MFSPRTFLQDNLSLSTKLFLKDWLATGRRLLQTPLRFAQRVANRLRLPLLSTRFDADVPAPPPIDYSLIAEDSLRPPREPRRIRTSIVIPVFNKAAYTFQCLRSLLAEVDLTETEIIVVDNGSTDETQEVLSHFSSVVRVIRNEDNRGFVEACNQGAAIARGKYLMFLNNDTVVLPGWLDNLIDTIESDQKAGAVGSMFLYPNGKIQEAGAIVWQNGDAHHYGWGGSPDDYRFNFAREVDYCSAASLLIRKDLFDRMGGFDRRYAPAYYEDIDLCFGVRALGYKVIYQPMSRVIHYEGATAGRDVKTNLRQHQVLNRAKFIEKWREVLERQHWEEDLKNIEAASSRDCRPAILVSDERVPSPDRDAGSARMFFILKTLAKSHRVVFLPFNRPQRLEYEHALWKLGIETGDVADYRQLLKQRNFSAAILSRPTVGEALLPRIRRYAPRVKIILDMVDTYFVRLTREYEVTRDPEMLKQATHYRKLEAQLARESDLVWCASPKDKRAVQQAAPGQQIEIVPTIHEVVGPGKTFAEREGLLFVGNMAHRPNADAVHFFMREIYSMINAALPGVCVYIAGDNAGSLSSYQSERVAVLGYVPDLRPYLEGARVFIAPIRFGAGSKGKVGEAMGHGLPVVATSIAAEGFDLVHAESAMIADSPDEFARAVVQVYTQEDLWVNLAENGRTRVTANFTPEVVEQVINAAIGN